MRLREFFVILDIDCFGKTEKGEYHDNNKNLHEETLSVNVFCSNDYFHMGLHGAGGLPGRFSDYG